MLTAVLEQFYTEYAMNREAGVSDRREAMCLALARVLPDDEYMPSCRCCPVWLSLPPTDRRHKMIFGHDSSKTVRSTGRGVARRLESRRSLAHPGRSSATRR